MTTKESLVSQIAEQMELPLELIHAVVTFQGEDAAKAAHIHREIEFSGFGKFLFSKPKALRKIKNMEKKLEAGNVKEETMEKYMKHLEFLKSWTNE